MAGIKIFRARSTEEYVGLVQQAIDEVFDLRQAIEFDADDLAGSMSFIDELETGLKQLYATMEDGSYQFATGDLPFMEIINSYHESLIPFKYLLLRINETHMKGLAV